MFFPKFWLLDEQSINRTSSQEDSPESSPQAQEESQRMFLTLKDTFVADIDAFDFSNDGKRINLSSFV